MISASLPPICLRLLGILLLEIPLSSGFCEGYSFMALSSLKRSRLLALLRLLLRILLPLSTLLPLAGALRCRAGFEPLRLRVSLMDGLTLRAFRCFCAFCRFVFGLGPRDRSKPTDRDRLGGFLRGSLLPLAFDPFAVLLGVRDGGRRPRLFWESGSSFGLFNFTCRTVPFGPRPLDDALDLPMIFFDKILRSLRSRM